MRQPTTSATCRCTLLAGCLLLAMDSAWGQWVGLQYRTALGDDRPAGRLSVHVERDQLPGLWLRQDRRSTQPRSPASRNTLGLPVFYHGAYVPSLVYNAATAQAERRRHNLSRLCLSHPLSCTVSGYAFAGSPFADLGLYGDDRQADPVRGPVRLAP